MFRSRTDGEPVIFYGHTFSEDWNYWSSPNDTGVSFSTMFIGVLPGFYAVYYWNADAQQWATVDLSTQPVAGVGYAMYLTGAVNFTFPGTPFTVTVADLETATAASGKHLIGPGSTDLDITGSTLEGITTDPDSGSQVTTLVVGNSYWVERP